VSGVGGLAGGGWAVGWMGESIGGRVDSWVGAWGGWVDGRKSVGGWRVG
jgi:hypothetical protein